jgi:nicotinate-nucleotide adenylyltransferase
VILKNHKIYVYPRVLTVQEEAEVTGINSHIGNDFAEDANVVFCNDAPVMKVSATFVRNAIRDGKDVRYLLTEPVHKYIEEMNFYR